MLLEISAIALLVLLGSKELLNISDNNRVRRIANMLYLSIVPLLLLFTVAAVTRISEIPSLN